MDSSLLVRFCCLRLQSVAKLFRFVELCVALVFFSWLSTRLPFAVRISGEYFRILSAFIVSPHSIFLIGNVIVVTLLAKSGLFSSSASLSVADLYEEFRSDIYDEIAPALEREEIVFQDKEMISEENTNVAVLKVLSEKKETDVKSSYQRSKSEKLSGSNKEEVKSSNEKLRRSETDIFRRDFAGVKEEAEDFDTTEDDLSNDEFRRTIEAFIDRQARFHREERLAVVLHGQS